MNDKNDILSVINKIKPKEFDESMKKALTTVRNIVIICDIFYRKYHK